MVELYVTALGRWWSAFIWTSSSKAFSICCVRAHAVMIAVKVIVSGVAFAFVIWSSTCKARSSSPHLAHTEMSVVKVAAFGGTPRLCM